VRQVGHLPELWIHLVHDRERERAIVSTILMLGRVP